MNIKLDELNLVELAKLFKFADDVNWHVFGQEVYDIIGEMVANAGYGATCEALHDYADFSYEKVSGVMANYQESLKNLDVYIV
jgi:hypothetical protein